MDPRPLQFIAQACDGKIISGNPQAVAARVNTDSRAAQAGDVFVALTGERFDGHEFITEVAAKDAAAVVVNRGRKWPQLPCAVIEVADTRVALGQIAAAYRREFSLPVIAVGGSNGKTTVKELLGAVLSQRLNTVWSEASFNNDIGVPHTLLRIGAAQQAAVIEVGTNHPGELAPLLRLAQPRYGVITSIGREHLEFFGDLAGVLREEGALGEGLPADGVLFLGGDGEHAAPLAARTKARVVRVGFAEGNDWRVTRAFLSQDGTLFRVTAPDEAFSGEYRTTLLGRHQVLNALFAIAVAAELGLTRDEIQQGLAACVGAKMRLQLYEVNGVRVLDDSYNANADSMIAALETLAEFPAKGRKLAVLGDMAELGAHTEAAHREVGRRAAELAVGQLFTVGANAAVMAAAAREAGLNRVMEFANAESAAGALRSVLKPGDVLLLKASRSARIERVVEFLRGSGTELRN
jgi:UDP-N-acetylmuramoyl-tripeptide--D-alanyl-D-alanine ligase